MGGMNYERPTAIKVTMNHANTSFSTEIFAGAIISVVQYLGTLRYADGLGIIMWDEEAEEREEICDANKSSNRQEN
jgi:hypothetical protein